MSFYWVANRTPLQRAGASREVFRSGKYVVAYDHCYSPEGIDSVFWKEYYGSSGQPTGLGGEIIMNWEPYGRTMKWIIRRHRNAELLERTRDEAAERLGWTVRPPEVRKAA